MVSSRSRVRSSVASGVRASVVVLLCTTADVVLVPSSGLAAEVETDRNGRIAFVSERTGVQDVWSMRPDGSDQVNLTPGRNGSSATPAWSPDGRSIAFMSDRRTPGNPQGDFELFVMRADGSHVRQVTDNALDDEVPSWSPDGRSLVFQRDFDPVRGQVDYDVCIVRVDGSSHRNLTRSPGVNDVEPDWSPDGRRIAFMSERDGDPEIYTMSTVGGAVRQLTHNRKIDLGASWSPDGQHLAFESDRDATPQTEFQVDIFWMRADGTGERRLTTHPFSDLLADWSPDGRRIAFTSFRDAGPGENNAEIYSMRADGSDETRLTRQPDIDTDPTWQTLPLG